MIFTDYVLLWMQSRQRGWPLAADAEGIDHVAAHRDDHQLFDLAAAAAAVTVARSTSPATGTCTSRLASTWQQQQQRHMEPHHLHNQWWQRQLQQQQLAFEQCHNGVCQCLQFSV
jgi:hypothetical protein